MPGETLRQVPIDIDQGVQLFRLRVRHHLEGAAVHEQAQPQQIPADLHGQLVIRTDELGLEQGPQALVQPEGLPQAHYLMAEFELRELRDFEGALAGFRAVVDSFPDSPWASKAAYAHAWLLETEAADTTGAEREYQALIERFPDTRYADFARMRMEIELPERPAGFYEDEQEGRLLAAVQVGGEIPTQALPDSGVSVPDSVAAPPDSLTEETSAEGDSLP